MEINVTTKYDYNSYKKFSRFFMFRGKYYKVKAIAFLTFYFIFLFLTIYSQISFGYNYTLTISLYCICAIIFIFCYFFRPRINYNKNNLMNSQTNYVFKENTISISTVGNGYNSSTEINYSSLRKIYETNDSFYLFVSLNQAFPVGKRNIDKINFNDLRNLLKSKMPPKKYIICK